MLFDGRGDEVAPRLLALLKGSLQGYEVKADDAQNENGTWSQTLAIRRGTWVGVDVDLKQEGDQPVAVEIDRASKGGTLGLLSGVVLAIVLAIASGDPLLEAIGITSFKTNLTIALAALAFMFVTVPVTLLLAKILGRSGAQESAELLQRVQKIVESARPA